MQDHARRLPSQQVLRDTWPAHLWVWKGPVLQPLHRLLSRWVEGISGAWLGCFGKASTSSTASISLLWAFGLSKHWLIWWVIDFTEADDCTFAPCEHSCLVKDSTGYTCQCRDGFVLAEKRKCVGEECWFWLFIKNKTCNNLRHAIIRWLFVFI